MHVLICDDEVYYSEAIRASIERWKAKTGNLNVAIDCFSSSEDMLEVYCSRQVYDLAFLDIQFHGEMNGLQVARELRKLNTQMVIVFISNYDEYATDGYKVNALRFLCKPVFDEQVFECLDIAYRQWQMALSESSLILEHKQTIYKIPYKSIIYIESVAPYLDINIVVPEKRCIRIRKKLSDILRELPSDMFVQCHQSFLVNLLFIQMIAKSQIVLVDKTEIPISIKYKETIYRKFKSIFLGESK